VVLAEDHALMRRSLRLLLEAAGGIEVVGEAHDLATAADQVHHHLAHVLVLDLGMSNGTSIEAIRRLRSLRPGTGIVVLTMEESAAFAQAALDAGAIGFVIKHAADSELMSSVLSAARGVEYVSPRVAVRLAAQRRAVALGGPA
jgi:DNA-binding NarL/FixJ family response regulator